MATKTQLELLDVFETSKPASPLFCHQEFLEKLAAHERDSIGRRVAFLLQRLAVDARRLHYKSTAGVNRGWRRSRLGGNHGSHFYAWWAPKNAIPLKESDGFSDAPEGSVFLRDIRHHDDHSLLNPQSFETQYMPVTVRDLRREEYAPLPWSQSQVRFAAARQPVRLLKGHPGSGKTTALWNAADSSGSERVLYVTYSLDLAALARDYFDRFCSSQKRFDVVTFPDLVRRVLGADAPRAAEREAKQRFIRDLAPFARTLGAWTNRQVALYDELYAHLVGDALPVSVARFAGSKGPRVPDKVYRERRTRFLGEGAAMSALDLVARLERLDSVSLADRYFPELALAWRAVEKLRTNGDLVPIEFDCLAIDECQDLTPIETFLLIELASRAIRERRSTAFLVAGDEAQTVRPTDFEWAWLSDLLHARLGTPSEYKLSANLRSPQRIAEVVNRVWDFYSHIQKQERPSGTGYAEIEDDATDQILYCSATPGPELSELLLSLSNREGLALVSLNEEVPTYIPEAARGAVLTVSEAKGLDFHSVCVLDGGFHIDRILRDEERYRFDSDLEGLRKRLAIDQLRVALSRPTERLIWLDINPTDQVIRKAVSFLNGGYSENGVSSCVPSALLKTLEEDELDAEERVQRCQADARQYLNVKPEMAWSRAHQAVTLLGRFGSLAAVTDKEARNAAHLTLAEVCFTLGLGNVKLPAELGRPDFFEVAAQAARSGHRFGLARIIDSIGRVQRTSADTRLNALVELAQVLPENKAEIEGWLSVQLGSLSNSWIETLEAALFNGRNAAVLLQVLPPLYEVLEVGDREARTQRLRQRAAQLLIRDKQFAAALVALRGMSESQPKLEAICYEGMGNFRSAAESHLAAGSAKEALNCYRSVPDVSEALKLAQKIEHPAADSLQWILQLQEIVAKRPDKFTKLVTTAEKKALEELLEQALGVTRKKPAPRKTTTAKKTAEPTKRTVRKQAPSKPKRPLRRDDFFFDRVP